MDASARAIQGRKDRRMSDTISRQTAMRAQTGRLTAIFAENGQKERINVINLSTYRKESNEVTKL